MAVRHDRHLKKTSVAIRKILLQPIGIIAIKSRETRAVIYTCRYSSGLFNPHNLAELRIGIKDVH